MWAQLIRVRVKGDRDAASVADEARAAYVPVRAAEQPGSGLVRALVMQDQADPYQVYALVVFESEEHARAREQDPRRQEQLQEAGRAMADLYDGPPEFVDLTVIEEWTG